MRAKVAAALMISALLGCASPNRLEDEPITPRQTVDVRPRLIGCSAGLPEPTPAVDDLTPRYVRVTVPVVVAPDGSVATVGVPQMIHSTADVRNMRLSSDAREHARYRAEGCTFEPAQRDGVPVTWSTSVVFAVLN